MKISEQVSNILGVSRAARNSDKELLIIYMQKAGMRLSDNQIAVFRSMPSVETIRRTRQQLQMDGKFPADQKIQDHRYEQYKEMRQGAGLVEPERVLEQSTWL